MLQIVHNTLKILSDYSSTSCAELSNLAYLNKRKPINIKIKNEIKNKTYDEIDDEIDNEIDDEDNDNLLTFNNLVPVSISERINEWGTFCDAWDTVIEGGMYDDMTYKFKTLKTPPHEWLIIVSQQFPTLVLTNIAEDNKLKFYCKHQYSKGKFVQLFDYKKDNFNVYLQDELIIQPEDIYTFLFETTYDMSKLININVPDRELQNLLIDFSQKKHIMKYKTVPFELFRFLKSWLDTEPDLIYDI